MDTNFIEMHFKSREEWQLARKIGGSDLATIMGESKWQTINELKSRLLHPETFNNKKLDKNARVQEGAKAEEYIRALWQLEHKQYKIIEPPKNNWLFVRKDNEFISVSPDGISEDYTCAIEIKDVEVYKKVDFEKWKSGDIPKQYFYQIMQYFIVIDTLTEIYLIARIKIMNIDRTLDHVEELNYHFTRKNFKEDIEKCLEMETKFIKELKNGNT